MGKHGGYGLLDIVTLFEEVSLLSTSFKMETWMNIYAFSFRSYVLLSKYMLRLLLCGIYEGNALLELVR